MPKSFELLGKMIEQLQAEEWVGDSQVSALPATLEGREILWRSLINQRPALPLSQNYLVLEDAYLDAWQNSIRPISLEGCQKTAHDQIFFTTEILGTLLWMLLSMQQTVNY